MCLGIPAKVIELGSAEDCLAEVGDGDRRTISLALLADDPVQPGDWVYVHLGFAMERLTEQEAREALELLASVEPEPAGQP